MERGSVASPVREHMAFKSHGVELGLQESHAYFCSGLGHPDAILSLFSDQGGF